MQIYLGTDHAGFSLKEFLKEKLVSGGYSVTDLGASSYDESDDYPDFVYPVARAVSHDPLSRGIVVGGSGQGEAIVANRVRGVRACVYMCDNLEVVRLSREHNDANVLSLGARFLSDEHALEAVLLWLSEDFSGDERHIRRIEKIDRLTQ